ncbi:potassium-transporting ATPase subunit C [Streptosporangium sp. 'caverna']|uniref:potassium-transporting ATPase subunit C n=1 Tax=Streptosporangium sp. 'caverna' TaxID=2202249 RepID=UPI000D7DED91|nr:potassium-transporting ATPase subunit C [Streptosporangium sp. 'caverna']AWS43475.1 potassium-transporting ATPase subunit C [Streptosporangium sp. 'caverna']
MNRIPPWVTRHLAALRVVLVLTVTVGLLYPLAMTGIAQALFNDQADGSRIGNHGSALIGQSFTDAEGNPLRQYFQSRPSVAGDGYDPTSTAAGNLGAESVVDTLPDPADPESGKPSLLTQVCARSKTVGELEGVSGARPYCTAGGVGATLGVFRAGGLTGRATRVVSLNQACPATPFVATYEGVTVECAEHDADYSHALIVPVRGDAPARSRVPADAVTAGGSGLDPHISAEYARLQAARVARARHLPVGDVLRLVGGHTAGRALGFFGEPGVNVLTLNLALDGKA